MSEKEKNDSVLNNGVNTVRRRILGGTLAGIGAAALGSKSAAAQDENGGVDDLHFPGDEPEHKVVYQFNKAELGYQDHVIFSVGEMLRKYGDNIKIVVVAFAEGIHILGKHPGREVKEEIRQRISSLAHYGVEFHACGNTMTSLKWTQEDLVDFAEMVQVGAADLMELQEQGYSYISW
jgi:intracellular sulfur oxidation DsrE/DsrF family protein